MKTSSLIKLSDTSHCKHLHQNVQKMSKFTFVNLVNTVSLTFITKLYTEFQNSNTVMFVNDLDKSEIDKEILKQINAL